MARTAKLLGVAEIAALTGAGRHGCGGQLYLEISPEGRRRWVVRYSLNGRPTWQALGPCDAGQLGASLRDARVMVRMILDAIAAGQSPRAVKLPDRRIPAGAMRITLADALDAFIAAHQPRWANEAAALKYVKTWTASIARRPVGSITVPDIGACFRPHWRRVPPTAQRTRRRLEDVFAYSIRQGWASQNPATLDALRDVLGREPKHEPKPHPSLGWRDVGGVLRKLWTVDSRAALALQFAILTASRTQEARDLRWCELDLQAKLWTLPPLPGRTKQRREHEIPLSDAAMDILRKCPRGEGNDLVFGFMARDALYKLVTRRFGLKGKACTHGFRASFVNWCVDEKITDSRVAEAQLGHKIRDKTRGAYERTTQLAERARVMEKWSCDLGNPFA